MTEIDKARFWSKAIPTDYCWNWGACIMKSGYGAFNFKGETLAHRISYQLIYGKISKKILVCHSCDNIKCINPSHLFLGTKFDNNLDKLLKNGYRKLGRSSRYHGVSFRNDSMKWRSLIKFNKKIIHIGSFSSELEAALAYDKKCYELYKRKEMLNFPKQK